MSKAPVYLIIGTMKGGTTALQDFICMHPEVAAPEQKEIHYFSLFPHMSRDWYCGHFNGAVGKIIGEASPTYFDVAYTQAVPRLIKAFNPEMRLILIVRDPVERAVSHFHHFRDVNKIAALSDIDINEFFFRPYSAMLRQSSQLDFCLHQTIDFSLYAGKLMSYLSVFDRDQLLVIDSAELKRSAGAVMSRVFHHLGIEDYYDDEFNRVKYSSGKTSSDLSDEVKDYLHEIFDEDYRRFWRLVGAQ